MFRVDDGWKLGDFGLVRGVEGSVAIGTGVKGTPLYLAPEALQEKAGPPSDVWALGVMVQECLSGTFPYVGETEFVLMSRLMTTEPEIPNLPAPFDAFVRSCLVRDRKQRWIAAEALAFLRAGGDVRGSIGQTAQPQSAQPIIPPSGAPATPPRPSPAGRAHARPVTATPFPTVAPSYRATAPAPSISAPASSLPPGLRPLGTNAQGYEEAENVKDGTVLIRIPAGTFTMGSDKYPDEKPLHRVTQSVFWFAKTTMTNAQYRKFVAETGHNSAGDWRRVRASGENRCPWSTYLGTMRSPTPPGPVFACPRRQSGSMLPAARTAASIRGEAPGTRRAAATA